MPQPTELVMFYYVELIPINFTSYNLLKIKNINTIFYIITLSILFHKRVVLTLKALFFTLSFKKIKKNAKETNKISFFGIFAKIPL